MDKTIRAATERRTEPRCARDGSWTAFGAVQCARPMGLGAKGWSDMELKVFSFSDTPLYAEALCTVLTGQSWVASACWQSGIEVIPRWDDDSRPDVVLVMCDPHLRPHWIRTVSRQTGARVVAVGVSPEESDVLRCAEAGACGYFFANQQIAQLRDVVLAAFHDEVLCPPRVVATLLRRVGTLAVENDGTARLKRLTPRECEILSLIAAGQSNKEMAGTLAIDLCTVKNHVHHIIDKLGVSRRGEAAALLHGLPSADLTRG
jgi:two-component system, NarL family, nitrate/nitrite response regulator NarL